MPNSESLMDKKITVMGLGQFGGGLGAVKYLLDQGAQVTLTDLRHQEELASSLSQIDLSRLSRLVLGEHREEDFATAELIVVNPAVRRDENRFLAIARQHGVELTSEINLFWPLCQAQKIVVTGSVGKSTTASLIHQCLLAAKKPSRLGGNIGISLLPQVAEIGKEEFVVLELSSFQLADLDQLHPASDLAVVTNFHSNHLDWHGSLENYRQAKQAAICWQNGEQIAILNGDNADSALWPTDARVIWFGHEIWRDRPGVHLSEDVISVRSAVGGWQIERNDLAPCLQNRHGFANVAAALAAVVVGLGIPVDHLADVLKTYQPLPHRLECVTEIKGRTFINDSKSTTPEATLAAVSCQSSPIILIAGGKDKGVDLSPLAAIIAKRVKTLVCLGETAGALQGLVETAAKNLSTPPLVFQANSLPQAVDLAWKNSSPGDVVLLSPGCASPPEFPNYKQRGERFLECVLAIRASDFGPDSHQTPA